jgi:DNA-directed RNA polymerase subunit N
MIIPIKCPTCGHVLADKWQYYTKKVAELKRKNEAEQKESPHPSFQGIQTKEILDELGLHKYCCRRVFLGHVDLIDEI